MFKVFVTLLLLVAPAFAGLPPTSTKGSGDSNPVTTFQINTPNIPITHSGTIATLGTIPPAGGGTGTSTTFTQGSVLYAGSTGIYSQDNANFFWDDTNHSLGLGNAAPGATYRLNVTGPEQITSASSTAFVVGANGATNPAFAVDASTGSSVTGLQIKSAASGGGVALQATSTNTDESISIRSKAAGNMTLGTGTGSGTLNLQTNNANRLVINNAAYVYTPGTSSSAATSRFNYTGIADSALTLSTEAPNWVINLGQIRQHATGALTLQRDFRVTGSTHSFVGASVLTDAASFSVDGPPVGGTNATITNAHGIYIPTSTLANTTNGFGLSVAASSGATNNYAAQFTGSTFVTSTASNAFTVGANGLTNPAFQVDASTASSVTGLKLTSAASGAGVTLATISSNANEKLTLQSKGTGAMVLLNSSTGPVQFNLQGQLAATFNPSNTVFTPLNSSSAAGRFRYTSATDTAITSATEAPSVIFDLSSTRTHANGNITLQRDYRILPTTHAFTSVASAITDAATLSIDGPPVGGSNATITNSHAIYVPTSVLANTTNSYGLTVNASSGATKNYAAQFQGGSVIVSNSGAALSTSATDGFLYIPTSAGVPIGTPTTQAGALPIEIDSTNNKLKFYSGGSWRSSDTASTNGVLYANGTPTGTLSGAYNTVIYGTEVTDTLSAYNPATGEYTCPSNLYCDVSAGLFMGAAGSSLAGEFTIGGIAKNGTVLGSNFARSGVAGGNGPTNANVSMVGITCNTNDILTIKSYCGLTGGCTYAFPIDSSQYYLSIKCVSQ